MEEQKPPENRNINTGGGNYNELIEGNYITVNAVYNTYYVSVTVNLSDVSVRCQNLVGAEKLTPADLADSNLIRETLGLSPKVKLIWNQQEATVKAKSVLFEKIREIIAAYRAKRITVLGDRGTGKTTLSKYMSQIIEGVNLVDTSGDRNFRSLWKEMISESDFIFYLVRVDKLLQQDEHTSTIVENDMALISQFLRQGQRKVKIFIIGTHCDEDKRYAEYRNINRLGDYRDQFLSLKSVKNMIDYASRVGQVEVVIGSLSNKDNAQELTKHITYK
ncbi:GTPase domain-containing protein [Nostoc sp. UCD121]|uniref:GTPase domain-containing protein n=1 Tax=unclassified Nostoc TaxID=2593658 RepID=UPI0016233F8C|nr:MULTISPECIES: GTPase domain-containing protein [unclassified Nostoc]MBC1224864.1 GTPase domain-containing protein [Nostoc sp. UCD120]MBC1280884.1 GTPase domain-containing protein [Nostoc sp. UCD121]MBC1299727.1 GTPase domain-containing protein [Nostoc sp. UCD122]